MDRTRINRRRKAAYIRALAWGLAVCTAAGMAGKVAAADGEEQQPGLSATFVSAASAEVSPDTTTLPNVWLYVPAGDPPTPFLPTGPFEVNWEGSISVDLRDDYQFQAELNGGMRLEINGELALEGSARDGTTQLSEPVRLNKGTNRFQVRYTSPQDGDAFIRLNWTTYEVPLEPIRLRALSHQAAAPELQEGNQIRLGRELVAEHRCLQCHALEASDAMPPWTMDAPSFEEIGSRRNAAWMAEWIRNPKVMRPTARMPQMLQGSNSREDAEAMAMFLGSLKAEADSVSAGETPEQNEKTVSAGKRLFAALHCAACHQEPEADEPDRDFQKIPLDYVKSKFAPGALQDFLREPNAHFEWTRMPQFDLSDEEAEHLAAYLISVAGEPHAPGEPATEGIVDRGRRLVQSSGCLNCHQLELENSFAAPSLAELKLNLGIADPGCLAGSIEEAGGAPFFGFGEREIQALQAFMETDLSSLNRLVLREYAERETANLNCRECHGEYDAVPEFDVLGGKLRPEWAARFIAGEVAYKPRPWLEARMPAFPKRAEWLARGMAMRHGYPPQTPPREPINESMAQTGRQLVSGTGGFFCISCHGVADKEPTQVFEAPGINLAYSGERLRYDYFFRWLRNPLRVDPQSKMPVYFDAELNSPLRTVFDGDGRKQIEALWHYIRQGREMHPPE